MRQNGVEPRKLFASRNVGGFSIQQGTMDFTKNPMDVAIDGNGYFVIQPKNGGNPSLSRRGDFQTNENGELLDGAGNKILDGGLNPVEIPAFREINISPQGERLFMLGSQSGLRPECITAECSYNCYICSSSRR